MRTVACVVALAALMAVGCASIETGTALNEQKLSEGDAVPVAHVYASNWGFYVFGKIPVVAGDYDAGIAVLKDTVSTGYVTELVTRCSRQLNASRTADLCSERSSVWIPVVPILTFESAEASGNALR